MNLFETILLSILTGIISGFYSGLIVYRYASFRECVKQMRNITNDFQYMENQGKAEIFPAKLDKNNLLINISMDFTSQSQLIGTEVTMQIMNKISKAEFEAKNHSLSYTEVEQINSECYLLINSLRPNYYILLLNKPIYDFFSKQYSKYFRKSGA